MNPMVPDKLIFIDLETTGANSTRDRITEIGLIEFHQGKLIEKWSTLINPETAIPSFIEQITGISNAMVAEAPRFSDIANDLKVRLSGKVLVAHNARFDYGFLKNEFRREHIIFNEKTLCTVKLSRALYPSQKRHNLDTLITKHNLQVNARHRAMGDAQLICDFFFKMLSEQEPFILEKAIRDQLKQPSLPPHLSMQQINNLPSGPGVYMFYGENNTVLYIGKSLDIRSRVLSHFSGDYRAQKSMQLSQQIRWLDSIKTAGELGALLLEARLIKELSPVHNRRLRRTRDIYSFKLTAPQPDSMQIEIVSVARLFREELDHLFGLFRSKRQAESTLKEIIYNEGLCHKVLGIERGQGACFNYQIKKCRGACVGKEPVTLHNARLAANLAKIKIRSWPFSGPIGIKESSQLNDIEEIHVFDRWCFLGTADSEDRLRTILAEKDPQPFDLDGYKILIKFLEKKSQHFKFINFSKEPYKVKPQ